MKKSRLLFMTLALGFLSVGALSVGNGKGANFNDAESVYNYKDFIRKAHADDSVVTEGWKQRIFGHFQNSNIIPRFSVDVTDEKVTMDVLTSPDDSSNSTFPKLAVGNDSSAGTDGLGYFYKEISDSSASFTLSATMDIEEIHGVKISSSAVSNYAVGLMVRDDLCAEANESNKFYVNGYYGSYAAVGNFGFPNGDKTNNIWYRDGNKKATTNSKYQNKVIIPSETNQTVLGAKLLLQKTENTYYLKYECTQGDNTVTIENTYTPVESLNGSKLYAGLFVAGPIKVSFKDIHYECDAVEEEQPKEEEEENKPVEINTTWKESIFGNFFYSDMTPNYSIDVDGSKVVLQDGVDESKNSTKLNSTSDGLLFRYQTVDASKDFKFKAKMQIDEINILDRAVKDRACGIQVRDDVLDNLTRNTSYKSDFIAVGNYGMPFGTDSADGQLVTKNAFGRVGGELTKFKANKGSENNKVYVPRVEDGVLLDNVVADLEIVKQNNNYTISYVVDDMVISYTQAMNLGNENSEVYVGLFVTGAMKVTFSDVYLEYAGFNSYLGHQESENKDAVRFVGNLFVGNSEKDLEKLNENYSEIKVTIYVILNGEKKYAELTTKGIMKQIKNGEEFLNADEGWYYFAIKIENIPEDVSLEIKKVETALIPVEKGE